MGEKVESDWGPEIVVNGDRPEWLGEQEPYVFIKTREWLDHTRGPVSYEHPFARSTREWAWRHHDGDPCIRAIRLPKEHPVYAALARSGAAPMSSLNEHTSGPWEWNGGRLFHNEPAKFYSQNVLVVHDEAWRPNEADARLIAAAPELLEAAQKAERLIDDMSRFVGQMSLRDYALFNEAPIALRTALAKARGQ